MPNPDPIMRWFTYAHLPPELQLASAPFCKLAEAVQYDYADTPQRALCLQLLLQAKDAAVRASMDKATDAQRAAIDADMDMALDQEALDSLRRRAASSDDMRPARCTACGYVGPAITWVRGVCPSCKR
jgi:predicted Zn-ribbon and HTH transcriptional regulator